MAINPAAKTEPQHPPLARDAQGHFIEIPEGSAAWRICRQTTGRPKEILGPDRRPLRLPLETTADELAELCGADVYRLYALDAVGKVLDYVTTVDVAREARAELRNGASETQGIVRAAPPAPTSDLRYALEAMTQMMRVNSDALRAVTESQADWVRSIASVRGFFRNAAPAPAPRAERDQDVDDHEDDEEPPQSKTLYDVLMPFAEHAAPAVGPLVAHLVGGAGKRALPSGAPDADTDLASKPNWELRDLVDLKYASSKANAKKAAANAKAKPSLQARVMADPELLAQFMAIKAVLEPAEIAQFLELGKRMSEQQQEWLLEQIRGRDPQAAATLLRETCADLQAELTTANGGSKSE